MGRTNMFSMRPHVSERGMLEFGEPVDSARDLCLGRRARSVRKTVIFWGQPGWLFQDFVVPKKHRSGKIAMEGNFASGFRTEWVRLPRQSAFTESAAERYPLCS